MKKFTKDHEWIVVDGDVGLVGITDHAQCELGDIVFVELPEIGRVVKQSEESAVIESVKAAGDIKSPVSGEIIEVNQNLNDEPSLLNTSAEEDGWVYKIKIANPEELADLLDFDAYQKYIG